MSKGHARKGYKSAELHHIDGCFATMNVHEKNSPPLRVNVLLGPADNRAFPEFISYGREARLYGDRALCPI